MANVELDDLYREVVLDHYRNPRNRKPLANPQAAVEGFNPLCGDELTLQISLSNGQIEGVALQARGCSISQASGSMMSEAIKGKSLPEVRRVLAAFTAMMRGDPAVNAEELGDLEALEGVRGFPVRVKCATLAWHTLEQALAELAAKPGEATA